MSGTTNEYHVNESRNVGVTQTSTDIPAGIACAGQSAQTPAEPACPTPPPDHIHSPATRTCTLTDKLQIVGCFVPPLQP